MKRFNPCALDETPAHPVDTNPIPEMPQAIIFSAPPAPTAEQIAKNKKWREETEALNTKRQTLFIAHYGQPDAPLIAVPEGMMAATVSLKFDNSDSQSDYFDRHASLSPDFVILTVKKQAQSERIARQALALLPELATFNWKWKTEKYSMGHGNYLESDGFELPTELQNLQNAYRSGGVTHGHWEIEFTVGYNNAQKILPHKNFGSGNKSADRPPKSERIAGLSLTINSEKNGLELRFPTVPDEAIRSELKSAGWRWSRFGGCWYVVQTPARREWAEQFLTRVNIVPATPSIPAPVETIAQPAPVVETIAEVIPPAPTPIAQPEPALTMPTTIPAWRRRYYRNETSH